jgi:hypothetical protein
MPDSCRHELIYTIGFYPEDVNRRRFLACLGVSPLVAGCLGADDGRTRLGRVVVANFTPDPVRVAVRVSESGTVVYDEEHDLSGDGETDSTVPAVSITDQLPADPGLFVVEYGLDDPSERLDLAEIAGGDCGQVSLDVRPDRRIESFYANDCDTLRA